MSRDIEPDQPEYHDDDRAPEVAEGDIRCGLPSKAELAEGLRQIRAAANFHELQGNVRRAETLRRLATWAQRLDEDPDYPGEGAPPDDVPDAPVVPFAPGVG
jgi:hypothetical protein